MLEFVCTTLPSRVIFGDGTSARLAEEIERLGLQRVLVLATPSRKPDAERLAGALGASATSGMNAIAHAVEALYGAWLCGVCLGSVSMAIHHKLCHVLGGLFNLPHAQTHTVILPHATAFNAPAAPDAMARLARALGATDAAPGAVVGLHELAGRLGCPRALRELGMPESGIDQAVTLTLLPGIPCRSRPKPCAT